MDKNKKLDNNEELINEINKKVYPDNNPQEISENSQPIISNKEIIIKENNISKNFFTGITPDMITVMNPDIIKE